MSENGKIQKAEKYHLSCPFQGPCSEICLLTHMSVIVSYCGQFQRLSIHIIKITSVGRKKHFCWHVYISSSLVMAVPLSPHFSFIVFPTITGIAFLFDARVPQHFIFSVCKSSDNSGDEVSTHSLWPAFLVIALSYNKPFLILQYILFENVSAFAEHNNFKC